MAPCSMPDGAQVVPTPESSGLQPALTSDYPCLLSGADLAVPEAGSSERHGDRTDLYPHVEEGLLGGDTSYLGPPLTPDKDEVLQQAAAVANLRAALMSKNSLLSLKADVLGEESSLLLECLPRGAHSLSCKWQSPGCQRSGGGRGCA